MNVLRLLRCCTITPRFLFQILLLTLVLTGQLWPHETRAAGTDLGEIEKRPAPVGRRICLDGANTGELCNEDADCPGSTCKDRNVFNLSVAVHYDAPAADLTAIENMITATSARILDVTDGQAEIGQATIHNNAFGTSEADIRIYPATCTSGASVGSACNTNADCLPLAPHQEDAVSGGRPIPDSGGTVAASTFQSITSMPQLPLRTRLPMNLSTLSLMQRMSIRMTPAV